jgi:DnaK suppressor protein
MDRNELKKQISIKIDRLKDDLVLLREECKPVSPDNAIGRVSRMDAINNKSVSEAALRKTEEKLVRLSEALTNINDPDFFTCRECSGEIEPGRILIMPESRLCVTCARKY